MGIVLGAGGVAARADLAVDFTQPVFGGDGPFSVGWQFTVNDPITVDRLGFFDYGKDGLTEPHEVAIYDASQHVVVQGTVPSGGSPGSWWQWTSATPTALTQGQTYWIAAQVGSELFWAGTAALPVSPHITFVSSAFHSLADGTLAFPETSDGFTAADGGAYFGPNFDFTAGAVTPVPLPGAVMLLTLGFATVVGLKRKSLL
jgi:hypothetical protein